MPECKICHGFFMSKSKVTTSKPKIALVFPGQGSQHVGMGLDLYEASPVAQEVFDQADKILGFPLSRLCFEGPLEELSQTINTQPAILAASVASLRLAMEAGLNLEDVSYVAGHSLGEYTALVAGRAMEFHHALDLVRERGRLMQEAAVENPGGMAAILGLELETVVQVCDAFGVQIANINCPGQIVISGDLEALEQASEMAKEKGARRVMPLEVRGAYHSNLMRRALRRLRYLLSLLRFHRPKIPLIANTTAQPLHRRRDIKAELSHQLCSCVQWQGSVEFMVQKGVSTFVEVGPGNVLSGLIGRISAESTTISLGNAESINQLNWASLTK